MYPSMTETEQSLGRTQTTLQGGLSRRGSDAALFTPHQDLGKRRSPLGSVVADAQYNPRRFPQTPSDGTQHQT